MDRCQSLVSVVSTRRQPRRDRAIRICGTSDGDQSQYVEAPSTRAIQNTQRPISIGCYRDSGINGLTAGFCVVDVLRRLVLSSREDPLTRDVIVLHRSLSRKPKWPARSKRLASPPEGRPLGRPSPPRPLATKPRPQEVSRSHDDTVPGPWHFEKSDDTSDRPTCLSADRHSNAWYAKLPSRCKLSSGSNHRPYWLYRKHRKVIWSVYSKTRICAPSTPDALPLCLKTSNWLAVSVENVPNEVAKHPNDSYLDDSILLL